MIGIRLPVAGYDLRLQFLDLPGSFSEVAGLACGGLAAPDLALGA